MFHDKSQHAEQLVYVHVDADNHVCLLKNESTICSPTCRDLPHKKYSTNVSSEPLTVDLSTLTRLLEKNQMQLGHHPPL